MEGLDNIIKYIVHSLTIKGFSVGCYCIDNCINVYVREGTRQGTFLLTLTALNSSKNRQHMIDCFVDSVIDRFG